MMRNFRYTLRNTPEEQKSHFHRDGSLKLRTRKFKICTLPINISVIKYGRVRGVAHVACMDEMINVKKF